MVEHGILPGTNRFELIHGRIVEKEVKNPVQATATRRTMRAIERLIPPGWHVRKEDPVLIPNRRSEPEPDLAVVRGDDDAYENRHPGSEDVALVVEVTRSSAAKDRKLVKLLDDGPRQWLQQGAGPLGRLPRLIPRSDHRPDIGDIIMGSSQVASDRRM